jgi:hypothetical protein
MQLTINKNVVTISNVEVYLKAFDEEKLSRMNILIQFKI